MIEYREFKDDDLKEYLNFCLLNFGKKSHQSTIEHLDWILSNDSKNIDIALKGDKVVGCIHSFKVLINIEGIDTLITVLYDFMVDKSFRGSIGLNLIQNGLSRGDAVLLPGSVGRISDVYNRLCSIQINSQWAKKIIFPRSIFYHSKKIDLKKYQNIAKKKGLSFGNNKTNNENFLDIIEPNLTDYKINHEFLEWRFINRRSPVTFYLTDKYNKILIMFHIGLKKNIPFTRIFFISQKSKDINSLKIMIDFIEYFSSKIGIFCVLITIFENSMINNLGYKRYNPMPRTFVYSKTQYNNSELVIPSFCSDIGFDATHSS